MTSIADALINHYTSLDSALVLAILADCENDEAAARQLLDPLAESAAAHEALDPASDSDEVERALSEWTLDDAESKSSLDSAAWEEDPLLFLLSIFPKSSRKELEAKLDSCDGDIERTVEHLMSEDYIRHQTQLDAASALERSRETLRAPTHRKAKKRKTQTISLTDVLHRTRADGSDSETDWSDFASTGNVWASLDSTAMYLAELMALSPAHLTSAYHRADSWAVAVENVLDELEMQRPFGSLPASEELLASASTQMDAREAKRLLCGTNGDLLSALDLAQWRANRSGASMTRLVASGIGAGRRAAILHEDSTLSPASPLPVVKAGSSALSRSSSATSTQRVAVPTANGGTRTVEMHRDDNASYEDYQRLADEYRAKQAECYRHAAQLVRLGDHSTRQGAGFYAQQGRDYADKVRTAEMKAAKVLVRYRQERAVDRGHEETTVDLHNLTVHQALTVVKDSTNAWWASAPHPAPLYIITGKGTHSHGGKSQLNPAIVKYLDREGWRFTRDGEAVIKVTGLRTSTR